MQNQETLSKSITRNGNWPITLSEAKNYMKVDTSADDTLINTLIENASTYAEQQSFLQMNTTVDITATIMSTKDGELYHEVTLPYFQSTVSSMTVEYWDDGTWASISDYKILTNKITVKKSLNFYTFKFQYTATADLSKYKTGVLKLVADMYLNREEQVEVNLNTVRLDALKLIKSHSNAGAWI